MRSIRSSTPYLPTLVALGGLVLGLAAFGPGPAAGEQAARTCGIQVRDTVTVNRSGTFTDFLTSALEGHFVVACSAGEGVPVEIVAAGFRDGSVLEGSAVSDSFTVTDRAIPLGSESAGDFGTALREHLEAWFGGSELGVGPVSTRSIQLPGGAMDAATRKLAVQVASTLAPQTGVVMLVLPAEGTDQGRIGVGMLAAAAR